MLPRPLLVLSLLALAGPPSPESPRPARPAPPDTPEATLAGMAWLAGTWSGEAWGGRFEAYYSTPQGGRVLGQSKLFRDGEEAYFEFEVFAPKDGLVFLQPYPGGRPADGFPLLRADPVERVAVFENPDKDWPTRIEYRRAADDELLILLSDPHGGSEKVERFELSR